MKAHASGTIQRPDHVATTSIASANDTSHNTPRTRERRSGSVLQRLFDKFRDHDFSARHADSIGGDTKAVLTHGTAPEMPRPRRMSATKAPAASGETTPSRATVGEKVGRRRGNSLAGLIDLITPESKGAGLAAKAPPQATQLVSAHQAEVRQTTLRRMASTDFLRLLIAQSQTSTELDLGAGQAGSESPSPIAPRPRATSLGGGKPLVALPSPHRLLQSSSGEPAQGVGLGRWLRRSKSSDLLAQVGWLGSKERAHAGRPAAQTQDFFCPLSRHDGVLTQINRLLRQAQLVEPLLGAAYALRLRPDMLDGCDFWPIFHTPKVGSGGHAWSLLDVFDRSFVPFARASEEQLEAREHFRATHRARLDDVAKSPDARALIPALEAVIQNSNVPSLLWVLRTLIEPGDGPLLDPCQNFSRAVVLEKNIWQLWFKNWPDVGQKIEQCFSPSGQRMREATQKRKASTEQPVADLAV